MIKIVDYLFFSAWLFLVVILIINPKRGIKVFPTFFRIYGINPECPSGKDLISIRVVGGIFLLVGLFLLGASGILMIRK